MTGYKSKSYRRNNGKPWTSANERRLRRLASENTPAVVISFLLGRTKLAVIKMASRLGVSLRLTNLRPYRGR